jgi:hypothetical protein
MVGYSDLGSDFKPNNYQEMKYAEPGETFVPKEIPKS